MFSTVAVFVNGLTVISVIRFKNLRTTTNAFVCSLAVADFQEVSFNSEDYRER